MLVEIKIKLEVLIDPSEHNDRDKTMKAQLISVTHVFLHEQKSFRKGDFGGE